MDINYNYIPLIVDDTWSLVGIVPPNPLPKKLHSLTTNTSIPTINPKYLDNNISKDINFKNTIDENNHIQKISPYLTNPKDLSNNGVFGNLHNKNFFYEKKNVLLGFRN
jgi:predicted transcriptional regulator